MKQFVQFTFIVASLLLSTISNGQTDAAFMEKARAALNDGSNCDEAMRNLNQVSIENRQTAEFYITMARTQDCKKNYEQAMYYYNKYQGVMPASDSVTRRIAELKDLTREGEKKTGTTNAYTNKHKKKKRKHENLNDNYTYSSIGYSASLGGNKAMFKNGIEFSGDYGIITGDNKGVVDIDFSTGILINPNETWFQNAFNVPHVNLTDISSGFSESILVGYSRIFKNERNYSFTAGPLIGAGFYFSPADIQTKTTFCYGLKGSLFLSDVVVFYSKLMFTTASSVKMNDGYYDYSVPVNFNSFTIGVGFRYHGWGMGWW